MPPSILRSSVSSLSKPSSISLSRSFTSTTTLCKIGPESPKFIEIPQTLQQQEVTPRDIKGILPPPRNLFPNRGVDKTDPEYFTRTTPAPTAAHRISEPQNDYIAWRRQLAETRRASLREGLLELHERNARQKKLVARQSEQKRKEREKRFNAPPPEDERLTSPTIRALNSTLQKGLLPDPDRESRLVEKTTRVQEKEALLQMARKDALHTLYMHARNFITTEEQLNARIEEIFVPQPWPHQSTAEGIWDALGAPPTVQDMLGTVNNTQKTAIDYHSRHAPVTGERIKKIAEELTGGKMD